MWILSLGWKDPLEVGMATHSSVLAWRTPRTLARQAPLSMGFSRREKWSGLPHPPPGDLPNPRIKPTSPVSPAGRVRFVNNSPLHWGLSQQMVNKCHSNTETKGPSLLQCQDLIWGPGSKSLWERKQNQANNTSILTFRFLLFLLVNAGLQSSLLQGELLFNSLKNNHPLLWRTPLFIVGTTYMMWDLFQSNKPLRGSRVLAGNRQVPTTG